MTSRERVRATVGHQEPDRVPYNLRLEQSLAQAVRDELGVDDLPEHFGHDIRYVNLQLLRPPEGVRETLRIMSPGGGYIASACHTLTEEVPVASVIAFHEAVVEYG